MHKVIKKSASVTILVLIFLAAFSFSTTFSLPGGYRKIHKDILASIYEGQGEEPLKVWIFLSEREGWNQDGMISVSERAVERMKRRSSIGKERYHIPHLNPRYLETITLRVERIRAVSRILRAISVEVRPDSVIDLSKLDFIKEIRPVAAFRRPGAEEFDESREILNSGVSAPSDPLFGKYGESLGQLDLIQAAQLLESGYDGSGARRGGDPVLICLLDTGFDLGHEAFSGIDVIAERDFIQGDSITYNEPGDGLFQDEHGTAVLGAIAGYHEGDLLSPAYGAQYILAKTEIYDDEISVEEDMWIMGIEWADSMGADIVTSSLGYTDWYTQDDLDGETALCTIVADSISARGVVVVNAMGNYGYLGSTSLIAPADGKNVISVGSVDASGTLAWNSSRGPTADGRIKPDIVAQGVGVHTVDPSSTFEYAKYSGTSMATPLIAGLCAQLLDLNPELSVSAIAEGLRSSGTRSVAPDNNYGYGVAKGLSAAGLEEPDYPATSLFREIGPNPFASEIQFKLFFPEWEYVAIDVYDCRGALIRALLTETVLKYEWEVTWDGRNSKGRRVPAGVYFLSVKYGDNRACKKLVFSP